MKKLKNKNGECRIENLEIHFTLHEERLTLSPREAL
jgi:hypothetical protein